MKKDAVVLHPGPLNRGVEISDEEVVPANFGTITAISELVTEGRARTVDISAFRPERFAEGKLIAGQHLYKPRRDHVEPTR